MAEVQRTLAIVKPDAAGRTGVTGQILARIEEAGLEIVALKKIQLSEQDARGFYAVHRERPYRIAPDNDRVRAAGPLHHSELADAQTVILPLYPELSEADQDYVIEQIPAALEEAGVLEPAR